MEHITLKDEYGPAKGLYVSTTGAKIGQAIKGADGLYYLHLQDLKLDWPSHIWEAIDVVFTHLNKERISELESL